MIASNLWYDFFAHGRFYINGKYSDEGKYGEILTWTFNCRWQLNYMILNCQI